MQLILTIVILFLGYSDLDIFQTFPCLKPFRSPFFSNWNVTAIDLSRLEENSHIVYVFLHKWCNSTDVSVQLRCLRDLNDSARDSLRDTVLGNEIFIAYSRIFHAPNVRPVL